MFNSTTTSGGGGGGNWFSQLLLSVHEGFPLCTGKEGKGNMERAVIKSNENYEVPH